MTATADFPVTQRPWRGYTDPGLPVGMWIAQGTILGDASGGNQIINFVFKGEGEPLGARFYNVEQVEAHMTRNIGATVNAAMVLTNFDIVGPTGLVNRIVRVPLDTDGVTDSALTITSLHLPIFLGRPQLVDLPTELTLRAFNTLNETLFFTAQGYIWEPRSLLVEGGLRRPVDSLYA